MANKKHFKRERFIYEGNHPDGYDTLIKDEFPELATACGVNVNVINEAIHYGPLHEKGMSARIGNHTVKVTAVKWTRGNGFGRDHSLTLSILE